MGLFGRKKVIDLTENYNRQQKEINSEVIQPQTDILVNSQTSNAFGFLANLANASSKPIAKVPVDFLQQTNSYPESSGNLESIEERKRNLAKRLMAITDRLEDLSNQIYHLQQRLEVVEKKLRVGFE